MKSKIIRGLKSFGLAVATVIGLCVALAICVGVFFLLMAGFINYPLAIPVTIIVFMVGKLTTDVYNDPTFFKGDKA